MFAQFVQIDVHFKTHLLKNIAVFPFCNVAGNLSVNDCSVWVSRSRWNKAIGRANSARNLEAALPKELGSACTGSLSSPAHVCPHHPGAGAAVLDSKQR